MAGGACTHQWMGSCNGDHRDGQVSTEGARVAGRSAGTPGVLVRGASPVKEGYTSSAGGVGTGQGPGDSAGDSGLNVDVPTASLSFPGQM